MFYLSTEKQAGGKGRKKIFLYFLLRSMKIIYVINTHNHNKPAIMAHICNPSTQEDRKRRITKGRSCRVGNSNETETKHIMFNTNFILYVEQLLKCIYIKRERERGGHNGL